ncbi:MAG: metallopeptidase family protein [Planctomycetota bacterium]
MSVALSRKEFERVSREAIEGLPAEYRDYLKNVELKIEDYPDDELMDELGAAPPHYPFGCYTPGVVMGEYVGPLSEMPGVLTLYRRPLEEWCRSREEILDQISRTVFHEIGHHFGFDEEDMPDWIEGAAPGADAAETRLEADRHLEQARADLVAADLLAGAGRLEWAFETAREAADRALRSVLFTRGLSDVVVNDLDSEALFLRVEKGHEAYRPHRAFADWDRIETGMGDAGAAPPCRRFKDKRLRQALETARGILACAEAEIAAGRAGGG